jgi:hypothetical protein
MKEASWDDCLISSSSSKVSPDRFKARSFLDMADSRIRFLESLHINEENANFIFEGYYSSLNEALHSLMISSGFKVDNHICLGFYLRDVLKDDVQFRAFDDARKKRNSLRYYGKAMDFEVAKVSIEKISSLFKEIKIKIHL